ncbi:30S ribosomal protein S7 [symbiont of Argiope bruennichi]|uniref:30S ribosomal protein S7 n=1 Tax=symbiont of Argiope bruennichi TaxID=2810479 RepID=UPI003DA53EB3
MRKQKAKKREITPDILYKSKIVTKLINKLMYKGNKLSIEKQVYEAFDYINQKTGHNPLKVYEQALNNVMPRVIVKSRRIGGANYKIPVETLPYRKLFLAVRWIIVSARERKNKTLSEKLALEIIDAAKNSGGAVKRREEIEKIAEANKAFAHFRW